MTTKKRRNGIFSVTMFHVETISIAQNFRSVYSAMIKNEKAFELSQWYREAHEICAVLSEHYKIPFEVVAGVMAVTSPQTNVTRNINLTTRLCASYRAGKLHTDDFKYIPAFIEKAIKMLESGKVFPHLRGDKVVSFYNNIIGNVDCVTLDVHMLNIAINGLSCTLDSNRMDYKVTGNAYTMIADILRLVSSEVGLKPSELQALLWTYCARNNQYFNGK